MFHHHFSSDDPTLFPPVGCSSAQPNATAAPHGGRFIDGHPPFIASSSPPYSSSLPSYYYLHRSSSTHSLSHPNPIPDPITTATTQTPHFFSSSSPHSSSSADFLDFHDEPVRRVFSTGDLQGMNGMPASAENCSHEGGAIATRVGRYSAEERKERIERYRSKRNQRNFHKKITYACRKTLADSRPRIRGRFARNGEMEMETEAEAAESCSNINCDGDWWQQMLGTTDEEEGYRCGDGDDILASFVDVFSMNLLS